MNKVNNVSTGVLNAVKATKNTSVKNLTVNILDDAGTQIGTEKINNMHQVWKFINGHYNDRSNIKHRIQVFQGPTMLKDIHAETKASGKVWKVDQMQIGKHVKTNHEVM